MSCAVIASTTVSELRLMFWALRKLWRMPVTTMAPPGAGACSVLVVVVCAAAVSTGAFSESALTARVRGLRVSRCCCHGANRQSGYSATQHGAAAGRRTNPVRSGKIHDMSLPSTGNANNRPHFRARWSSRGAG